MRIRRRGHFPFPLHRQVVPEATVSLEDMMRYYWRVKTWRVTCEFACIVEFTINDGTMYELDCSGSIDTTLVATTKNGIAAQETDLQIWQDGTDAPVFGLKGSTDGYGLGGARVRFIGNFGNPPFAQPYPYQASGNFGAVSITLLASTHSYPEPDGFVASDGMFALQANGGPPNYYSLVTFQGGAPLFGVELRYTFDIVPGLSIPVRTVVEGKDTIQNTPPLLLTLGKPELGNSGVVIGDSKIKDGTKPTELVVNYTPASYWPYIDRFGTPLYDKTTGASLLGDPVAAPWP